MIEPTVRRWTASRLIFAVLILALAVALSGCAGYNDYMKSKGDINRAKAAEIRAETDRKDEMHAIRAVNTAKAGPVLAYAFAALACGCVVIAIVYFGGQATAEVITAHAEARDVHPDTRGFLPVRVDVLVDTRPRGLLAAFGGGQYGRDWVQIAEVTNYATGAVRRRIAAYSCSAHQVTVYDEVVSAPDDRLITADAQHRILALIAHTARQVARERGDASVVHALDTLRAQVQGLPGMSTPAPLPAGDPRSQALTTLEPDDYAVG